MIREAQLEDFGPLVEMGIRFLTTTPYAKFLRPSPEALMACFTEVVEDEDGAVFVSEEDGTVTGFIAMKVFPHPYSGERIAGELAWWVEPESRGGGVRLLKKAEKWAKDKGVKSMQMIAPSKRVGVLYERLGYEQVETAYQRSL